MKKFLIVCLILFIASVGCKKSNIEGGGGLCACSPIMLPELRLVVKNSTGEDLLNEKTTGAFTKENIQLYRKDNAGQVIPVAFYIRPPFTYGNEKFNFNQLTVQDISYLQDATNNNALYLKLGSGELHELNMELNTGKHGVEKLLIDKIEAEKDKGTVAQYGGNIFYLTE
jgi:hypothetical protein